MCTNGPCPRADSHPRAFNSTPTAMPSREREKLGLLDQDVSVDVALFQKQAKFHFSAEGSANGGGGGRAEEGEGEGEGGGGGGGEGEVGHGFGVGFGEVAFGGQFGNAINRQTFFLTGASPRDMRRRPEEVRG